MSCLVHFYLSLELAADLATHVFAPVAALHEASVLIGPVAAVTHAVVDKGREEEPAVVAFVDTPKLAACGAARCGCGLVAAVGAVAEVVIYLTCIDLAAILAAEPWPGVLFQLTGVHPHAI